MKEPVQSRSRDSMSRVLDSVLDILAREGLNAVTTARVAKESGVSNGSIYHRFGTRRALLIGAMEQFTEQLRRDVAGMRSALPGRPAELSVALDLLVAVYRGIFTAHGGLIRAFFVDALVDRDLADRGEADKSLFIDQIGDFLDGYRAEITSPVPERAFEMVHRLLFGYFMMRTLFHDDTGDDVTVSLLTSAVRGMLTDPAQAPAARH